MAVNREHSVQIICFIYVTGVCVTGVCVCEVIKKKHLCYFFLLDSLTHIQSHLHTVPGVVRQGLRQARHAVVAISQDLDAHALVLLNEEVKKKKREKKKEE